MERTETQPVRPTPHTHPTATPGDVYIAAATADHHAHCTNCREHAEQTDAHHAENSASIARRDRHQLGLHTARTTAVTA